MHDLRQSLAGEISVAKSLLDTYRAELGEDASAISDFLEGQTDLYTVMDAVVSHIFELEDQG